MGARLRARALVRPNRRSSAQRRVEREIIRNDADTLGSWGDEFDAICEQRISVVSGTSQTKDLASAKTTDICSRLVM